MAKPAIASMCRASSQESQGHICARSKNQTPTGLLVGMQLSSQVCHLHHYSQNLPLLHKTNLKCYLTDRCLCTKGSFTLDLHWPWSDIPTKPNRDDAVPVVQAATKPPVRVVSRSSCCGLLCVVAIGWDLTPHTSVSQYRLQC